MSEKYTYKPEIEPVQFVDGNENDVLALLKSIGVKTVDFNYTPLHKLRDMEYSLKNNICGSAIAGDWIVKKTYSDGAINLVGMTDYGFRQEFEKVEEPIATSGYVQAANDVSDTVAETVSNTVQESDEPIGRVAEGNKYWLVCDHGSVSWEIEQGRPIDRYRYDFGNYFKSKPECEQARDKQLLDLAAHKWREQHDPVALDWRDGDQKKWKLYYYYDDELCFDDFSSTRDVGGLYFSTRIHAEQFYNEHKELIHKVLGVE